MKVPDWFYLTRRERMGLYFIVVSILLGEILVVTRTMWEGRLFRNAQLSGTLIDKIPNGVKKWPIDLNTATYDELLEIPGIGPTLAYRIIRRREEKGFYSDLKELLLVKGIGEKLLRRLKVYLKVERPGVQDKEGKPNGP